QIPRQLRPFRLHHPRSAYHRTLRANLSAQNESQRAVTRLLRDRFFHRLESGGPDFETLECLALGPRLRGDERQFVACSGKTKPTATIAATNQILAKRTHRAKNILSISDITPSLARTTWRRAQPSKTNARWTPGIATRVRRANARNSGRPYFFPPVASW